MGFTLGYAVPAGTAAFDDTRGAGPQEIGFAWAKVIKVEKSDKPKSVQAALTVELQSPPSRKGETFMVWENVGAKAGSKESFAKVCREKVANLLGAIGHPAFDQNEGKLTKGVPANADLEKLLVGKVLGLFTVPGDEAYLPQINILPKAKAEKVEAGEAEVAINRQKKMSGGGGSRKRPGKSMGDEAATLFDDDAGATSSSDDAMADDTGSDDLWA